MPITPVDLTDTFDVWRTRTNQIINLAESSNTVITAAFGKANAANVLAFNTGIGANAYATAAAAGANAYMIAVQTGSNTAVGTGANAFASATIAGANAAVGTGANAFATAAATSAAGGANAYMISVQNGSNTAVGTGANAYATAASAGANAYMIAVQNGSNTAIGAGANAYAASTFLANTSGASFVGNLSFPNGNVGIGKAATTNRLDVAGTINAAALMINGVPLETSMPLVEDVVDATRYITFANNTTGTFSRANVSTSLTYNPSTGTLSATVMNSTSDISQKKNVISIVDALSTINAIEGVQFEWKKTGQKSYGVIAQEIEKIIPEIVDEADGIKSVNYSGIIAFLIQAIKELNTKLENK